MNARVLELIKNPELFQNQDINLLNSEIKKYPYIQNIRALQLFGIHRFQAEEYHNALSTTAAYTTDKKILYQFINRNLEDKIPASPESADLKNNRNPEKTASVFSAIASNQREQQKPVYVNGALNRILFEGEEDFLEQKSEVIDLESTMESGQLVIQSKEVEAAEALNAPENPVLEPVKFEEEIKEEKTITEVNYYEPDIIMAAIQPEFTEETESNQLETLAPQMTDKEHSSEIIDAVEDQSEISFHGTEEFLSEVKIVQKVPEPETYKVPKPQLNKHEMEMQRLIAEVEAKMKSGKKIKTIEKEQETPNHDINFSQVQNFNLSKPEDRADDETIEEKSVKKAGEKPEVQEAAETPQNTLPSEGKEWKPMSFSGNTPDSLITHKEAEHKELTESEIIKTETSVETVAKEKNEERPVFNVSFFTQNVSSIESDKVEKLLEDEVKKVEESNVPTFINTWQNWLKIDRNKPEQKTVISPAVIKNTVIENFIVKEPKISKLKEESDFVVKEKSDNISHLMTETLAKLYVEQKLYSKAIKAFQILSEKHPEKKSHFGEQINSIKKLRQNK